jgi:DNA polymerase-3 subunit delta'
MAGPAESYPWHAGAWQALRERHAQGRLPHALLLSGPQGVGRHAFARRLAAALLCAHPETEQGDACGACPACRQFTIGSHPDYRHVRLLLKGESVAGGRKRDSDATQILVDQVRDLSTTLSMSAQHGGWKVAVIDPADQMMAAAANALLKTLEEPTARTLLVLVASRPGRMLATIRSRCQAVVLPAPPRQQGLDWLTGRGVRDAEAVLAMADGAPLLAERLAGEGAVEVRRNAFDSFVAVASGREDPVAVAAAWSGADTARLLGWLGGWLVDLIRLKQRAPATGIDNHDLADRMQALVEHIELDHLFARLDDLQRARRLVTTQVNTQLLCEELMLGWRPRRSN